MNFREGMRRLGLAAGISGALLGTFVSYEQLGTLLSQRARYQMQQEIQPAREDAKHMRPQAKTPDLQKLTTEYDRAPRQASPAPPKVPDGFVEDKTYNPSGFYSSGVEAPKLSAFFLLLVFPVIGFLLPWGAIRSLSWIVTGFSKAN